MSIQIKDLLSPANDYKCDNYYLEIGDINVKTHQYILDRNKSIVDGAVKAKKGTILISTVRPTRGAIVILKESIFVSSAFCQIYIENLDVRNYIYQYFLLPSFTKYLADNSEGGTYPTVKDATILNHFIKIPSDEKMKFTGLILNSIDISIIEKNKMSRKTKQYKEAMLYKMFPKKGSKVPEIRFKGFEGEWETKVFEKAFDRLSNNSIKRDLLNYKKGNVKNIHYGDVLIKFDFTVDPSDMKVPYINEGEKVSKNADDYLITGDVVFADTAEDTTAGKVTEIINTNGVKTLAGLHTYPCRPLDKYVPGFLGIMLNTSLFHNQLIPYMQGTKVTGFNYGQLCKTVIYYPGNDEQKKIVEFFDNLDSKIKNQEKEITILENYKATLLEKMFA